MNNRMQKSLLVAAFLSCFLTTSCFTYRTKAPNYPGVAEGGEVVWSLAWGLVQEQPCVSECNNQPLAEVTVHSNLAFDLLTVATLGLASPKKVEWRCARANPGDNIIPTASTQPDTTGRR